MTDPTPPSLPPLPASGGELFHEVMKTTDPRFGLNGLTDDVNEQTWNGFPEAVKAYAQNAMQAVDSLAHSVSVFSRETGQYMEGLSRRAEEKKLGDLESTINADNA